MTSSPHLPDFLLPSGFQFAAVKAGLKPSGKPDFAIAVADETASAAAMFTSNRVVAAPIIVGRENLLKSHGRVKVVAVNAGNANCATGEAGIATCREVCAQAAATFDCATEEIFPSSTGIIGVPLPGEKLIAALPEVKSALGKTSGHFDQFAHAILTTDTRRKVSARHFAAGGKQVKIVATCKGAGMIHPQLVASRNHARLHLHRCSDRAGGAANDAAARPLSSASTASPSTAIPPPTTPCSCLPPEQAASPSTPLTLEFRSALAAVCTDLAKQIVADGEGVTHVVELRIEGAPSDADALKIARSIAHSPLVKTAWAGSDPNWGRILAAVGYSGVEIDPGKINIWFGDHEICRAGGRSPLMDEHAAHLHLTQSEYHVRIDLGIGSGSCRFWTCDLTKEYVAINADYST